MEVRLATASSRMYVLGLQPGDASVQEQRGFVWVMSWSNRQRPGGWRGGGELYPTLRLGADRERMPAHCTLTRLVSSHFRQAGNGLRDCMMCTLLMPI